jgi:hypothetical protein|tara:strand:- start:898 stop:1314 length:417 start_codon:yes stop_codon:yes gene_type:complete
MAKKKKTRRRTPKTMSLYDAAVAWGNLTILTEGTVGSGPIGFITGEYDIQSSTTTGWSTDLVGTTKISGNEQISMRDMLNDPGLSFGQITENVKNNAVGMTVNALVFNAGARILKRAIRQPINQANRFIRPLGLGVRI